VLLIVNHNLVSGIDGGLQGSLTAMAADRASHGGPPGTGFKGPPGQAPFGAPVLWWSYHPDGNYDNSSPDAANIKLPVSYRSITGAQTLTVSGTDLRVMGGRVGDDWVVVGQSMASVSQAQSTLLFAELLVGPFLLAIVFLGALSIGRRVAAPIERARQRQLAFTANASHELRTPLSVIQAQTALALSQARDGGWYRTAFQRVDDESKRMRRLVDDLLWLARFDAAPRDTKAEPVDVGVMAQQAVDRFATIAEAGHLRLGLRLSTDSHVIAASPEWLDHLIGVLLDNACKYSPENGTVDVRVLADGNRVTLWVDDSGPGIPPEERERIFDRFHRATDRPGGAGLGLAIADAVVRATGGRWEVGSSPAGGASMAVSWPRLLAPSGATPAGAPVGPARRSVTP
jgi:signal transduction histidine kinase